MTVLCRSVFSIHTQLENKQGINNMACQKAFSSILRGAGAAFALLLSLGSSQAHAVGCPSSIPPIPVGPMDAGTQINQSELTYQNYLYPKDLVPNANQTQKANYAWRLFIASMQQTKSTLTSGSGRGAPSGQYSFIDTGASSKTANPLVFESLYHRTEAFPYYVYPAGTGQPPRANQPPCPINQPPVTHTFYEKNANPTDKGVELDMTVTVPVNLPTQYVYLDETNQISQNFLYYQHSNDPDFPVLFMAKVNQLETDYAFNKTTAPSATNSWDFPNNVVEVKTAWRRASDLTNSSVDKYHSATANYWLADTNGHLTLQTDTFVLIAIHIIQKTKNYPEFIFSTFEHVDSVTRNSQQVITDPAYKTEYNQLAYQTPNKEPHTATALGAYNANETGQPSQSNKLRTYNLPPAGPISQDFTTVVQPYTITSQVNDVNNQVNQLVDSLDKGNVWAHYRLKGVQAGPTNDSDSADYFLANIVVESSQPGIQLFNGILLNGGVPKGPSEDQLYLVNCRENPESTKCVFPYLANSSSPSTYDNVSLGVVEGKSVPAPKYNMGGCQGCHGAAQQLGRDFSFLANGVLGKGKELDSVPASDLSATQKKVHNTKMSESSNAY
ncbi:MAG: hypothetical protein ACR2PT_16765 [Endozoicomonas sp.]